MIRKLFFLLPLIVLIGAGRVFSLTLGDLEERIGKSYDAQILDTEISREQHLNEKAKSESGMKLFGNAGYSWIREPESLTSNEMIYYEKLFGRIGVSIPVIGSKWQEDAGILKGERSVLEKQHDLAIYRKTAKAVLRKEYVELWNAQRKAALFEEFLRDEDHIRSILKERVKPGFLLDSDFQEFMTPFGRARRDLANCRMIIGNSKLKILSITGESLNSVDPIVPDLPEPETDANAFEAKICSLNPELEILEQIALKNSEITDKTGWSVIESSIDIAYAPSKDYPGEVGQGASLSLNLRAPLEFNSARNSSLRAAEMEKKKSLIYFNKRKAGVYQEFMQFNEARVMNIENLKFANQRLRSATETMREARLRLQRLPGDVLEKFLQARYNMLGVALDALDAEAISFKACADLLMVAENKDSINERDFTISSLPGNNERRTTIQSGIFSASESRTAGLPDVSEKKRLGVFLWESAQILDSPGSKSFWDFIESEKIGRILVSFDMGQIKRFSGKSGASSALSEFLANARQRAVSVELLLGEPTWILPEKRKDLVRIVKELDRFDFEGINLDIEPDQLGDLSDSERKKMAGYMLETMREVSGAVSRKLGITVHPRYFDKKISGLCFGCELEKRGVTEAVLMIYSSDTKKVAEVAEKIMAENHGIKFSVAQSVEKELSAKESHYGKKMQAFNDDMKRLNDLIRARNFNSIIVQSYRYLRDMKKD